MYHAGVSAVSGDREYDIVTPNAFEAKEFLLRYDHEGGTVTARVVDWDPAFCRVTELAIYENMDAYEFLLEEIAADKWDTWA